MAKIIDMKNPTAAEPVLHPESVKRIWCRIGLHVWSRWIPTDTVEVFEREGDKLPLRREGVYAKQCCECDLVETKRVKL